MGTDFLRAVAVALLVTSVADAQVMTSSVGSPGGYSFTAPQFHEPASVVSHYIPPGTAAPLTATNLSPSMVNLNQRLTQPLTDFQNRQTDKELLLIDPELNPYHGTPSLTLGAQFRASAMVGRTNSPNQFSYLGRFPTDFVGQTVTDARLLQANQAFVANFGHGVHGYLETLFSDVFTFDDPKQGSFQVRQAYVVLGDLSQSPWYLFGGKKNVNIGDFGTLSPFTQAVPWHYFAPLTEGIGGGYASDWINFSVMALNGSRGIRVTDSEERGHLNNFSANLLTRFPISDVADFSVGGGYLHGTIYDGAAAEHLDATVTGPRNGLWDVNALLRVGDFRVKGEFLQTQKVWPVTGHQVTAYAVESSMDTQYFGRPARVSASWSEGIQGPSGSQFEFNRQLVIGLRLDATPNMMLTFEYVRSLGFAPLINITTVSNRNVDQNSFVFGMVLTL